MNTPNVGADFSAFRWPIRHQMLRSKRQSEYTGSAVRGVSLHISRRDRQCDGGGRRKKDEQESTDAFTIYASHGLSPSSEFAISSVGATLPDEQE